MVLLQQLHIPLLLGAPELNTVVNTVLQVGSHYVLRSFTFGVLLYKDRAWLLCEARVAVVFETLCC